MWTSYLLARTFLLHLNQGEMPTWNERFEGYPEKSNTITAADGWSTHEEFNVKSPFYNTEAWVHYSIFNHEKIFFCHAFDAPTLVKPEIIAATWLHLHIAILLACEQQLIVPKALQQNRIAPALPGLKTQPQINFPLAFAALSYGVTNPPESDEPLPF